MSVNRPIFKSPLPSSRPTVVDVTCPVCEADLQLTLEEESFDENRTVRIWIGTGRCVCGRIICATGYFGLRMLRLYSISTSGRRSASIEFLRKMAIPHPGK